MTIRFFINSYLSIFLEYILYLICIKLVNLKLTEIRIVISN